jgi:hypothetical protein
LSFFIPTKKAQWPFETHPKINNLFFLLQTFALNAQHLLAGASYFVDSHLTIDEGLKNQKGSLSKGYKTFIGAGINSKTKYLFGEIFWSERKSLKLDNSYGVSNCISDTTKYFNKELGLSIKMLTNSASQEKLIFFFCRHRHSRNGISKSVQKLLW